MNFEIRRGFSIGPFFFHEKSNNEFQSDDLDITIVKNEMSECWEGRVQSKTVTFGSHKLEATCAAEAVDWAYDQYTKWKKAFEGV